LIRALGFGIGVVLGATFKLSIQVTYAWTANLLKKATGRASSWVHLVAAIAASVIPWIPIFLALLPLDVVADRQAYGAGWVWGVLVGVVFQRLRELRDS
jgi:hypothetical protein